MAFLIARAYGREFVRRVTSEKFYNKYSPFMNSRKFTILFALLIFSPVAPDDFLCYLAGITDMKLSKFTIIILLGKPLAIFMYSFALTKFYTYLITLYVRGDKNESFLYSGMQKMIEKVV